MSTRLRGSPKKGEAPAGQGRGIAGDETIGRTVLDFTIAHPPAVRRTLPRRTPHFDPNEEQRRCSVCGGRDGWRRWHSIGGAWAHCPPQALLEHEHGAGELDHACSPLCALRGAA